MKSRSNTNTNNNNGSITSMTIDDLHDELILDCATLVKANSIAGCKVRTGTVATTRNSIQRKKGREKEKNYEDHFVTGILFIYKL